MSKLAGRNGDFRTLRVDQLTILDNTVFVSGFEFDFRLVFRYIDYRGFPCFSGSKYLSFCDIEIFQLFVNLNLRFYDDQEQNMLAIDSKNLADWQSNTCLQINP